MESNEQSNEQGGSLDNLLSLGEALAADDTQQEPSGEEKGESRGSEDKATPTKFNDLAGATGMELDSLYELTINFDDSDEGVTVEQLKDSYRQRSDFDIERMEFEEQRTQAVNQLVREKAELQELLSELPATALKPETLNKLRERLESEKQVEREKTLELIPDWKDEDRRAQDIKEMSEHLVEYGFTPTELASIKDHRWFRYIREAMRREQRIKAALAQVRKKAPDNVGGTPPQPKPPKRGSAPKAKPSAQSKLEDYLTF